MGVKRGSRLRALLPWVLALGILLWLFRVVPPDALQRAIQEVNPWAWAGFIAAYVMATLAADALATWMIYRRSLPDVPLRYGETFRLRGATYLLSVLHYGAGQGGMAYFLKTRYGVEIARAAGAVILTMGTNAITVAAFALVGLLLGGAPEMPALRAAVYLIAAGLPVYLAIIAWSPRVLTSRIFLRPLFDAGVRGHALIGLARIPHLVVLIVGHWIALRLFGVHVPFAEAVALLPLVFVVGVLPISPSGLGTAQATAVALFTPFAAGATVDDAQAAVLGYSLGLHFSGIIGQALVGLVFLRLSGGQDTIRPSGDHERDAAGL